MEVLDVPEVVVEGALGRAQPGAEVGDRDRLDAAFGEERMAGVEVVVGRHPGHRAPYSRVWS